MADGPDAVQRILVTLKSPLTPDCVSLATVKGRSAVRLSAHMLLRWIDNNHYLAVDRAEAQRRRYAIGRGRIIAPLGMTNREWFAFHKNGSPRWVQQLVRQSSRMRLLIDAMNIEMTTRWDEAWQNSTGLIHQIRQTGEATGVARARRMPRGRTL